MACISHYLVACFAARAATHDADDSFVRRFLGHLWLSARRPAVFRHCATISLVVGALLCLVNQGTRSSGGRLDATAGMRIIANFLIPFVVSHLGAMRSLGPGSK